MRWSVAASVVPSQDGVGQCMIRMGREAAACRWGESARMGGTGAVLTDHIRRARGRGLQDRARARCQVGLSHPDRIARGCLGRHGPLRGRHEPGA